MHIGKSFSLRRSLRKKLLTQAPGFICLESKNTSPSLDSHYKFQNCLGITKTQLYQSCATFTAEVIKPKWPVKNANHSQAWRCPLSFLVLAAVNITTVALVRNT